MNRKLNVYLCGNKVGELSEDDLLQLSFRYVENASLLSVSLPVRKESYSHAAAFPFFENLAPEGEAFDLLTKDHVSGNKIFSILDRFGGDCAGAVTFYESTPVKTNQDQKLYEIPSAKVAQIIDRLPDDPLLTSLENPPRLSLAGAQSKFAVHKSGEKYYRSTDEYPTTHIIKITNKRFTDLLKNELFCMKLAKAMKLDVPDVEIKEVDGRSYIEIQRYDRIAMPIPDANDVKIKRIHQEDFCQALGIVSDKKYQSGGGPRLKDCLKIIEDYSSNRLIDIMRFIEWIIFNYLIGNTDAHAKNLSLLYVNNGIRLAPFYDLLSTEVYPEKIVDHSMAMLVNGKGKYSSLRPKDFAALFENLGLNATNMMKSIKDRFAKAISTAENLCESLLADEFPKRKLHNKSIYIDIVNLIKKRFEVINYGK